MARPRKNAEGSHNFLMSLSVQSTNKLDELAKQTGQSRLALVRKAVDEFLAEQSGEKFSVELPDELRVDLAALQKALDSASAPQMIANALREYVITMLAKNSGIQERFSRIREEINAQGGRIIAFRQPHIA